MAGMVQNPHFCELFEAKWTVSFCRKGQRLSKLAEAEKLIWTSLGLAPSHSAAGDAASRGSTRTNLKFF
jgi:hypothetical protein